MIKNDIKIGLRLLFLIATVISCNNLSSTQQDRIAVLNQLQNHYHSRATDSIAISQHSYQYKVESINFDSLKRSYNLKELLAEIPEKDLASWQGQLTDIQKINWEKWGWTNPSFISKEQYPDHLYMTAPPEPTYQPKPPQHVYSFSIPLVADHYSFVNVAIRSSGGSYSIAIVVLEKDKSGTWEILGTRTILTT